VSHVARELGVSERQLLRVFREAVGVSPKAFARLARFHRAVDGARAGASWTRIAAATGYCDQAHLIDEFQAITGTTPRRFMVELGDAVE
jgi:AraC-like DNA-binding protein